MNPAMCHLYWNGDGCDGHEWGMLCHSGTSCTLMEWCSHQWMMKMVYMSKFLSFFLCFFTSQLLAPSWLYELLCFSTSSVLKSCPSCYWLLWGTSIPVRTLKSCLALTSNASHASLAVPLLKYFCHIFNQTAVAKMQVGPFLGDLTIPGASSLVVPCFLSFVVWSQQLSAPWGPSSGFKYWARTFTCTSGHIATFRTVSKLSLLVILPSDEMFAHAMLMWVHALLRWSKVEMINAHSSSFLIFSGSCHRNSQPVGTSVAGSLNFHASRSQMLSEMEAGQIFYCSDHCVHIHIFHLLPMMLHVLLQPVDCWWKCILVVLME